MIQIGIHAVISIIIYLICIGLAFQAVKIIQISKIIKKGKIFETQILYLFLSISLGFLVGNFIVTFIDASLQLSNLF